MENLFETQQPAEAGQGGEECRETLPETEQAADATPVRELLASVPPFAKPQDNTPAAPQDYMQDGVLHCGVCHKPKYILRKLLGVERAFPINCDCREAQLRRQAEEQRQQEKLLKAEDCRRHALPYAHMHNWDFDHDDGGSPQITDHAKQYALHFAELKRMGLGLFLFGVSGTGKTYAAVQIVNALCDEGYRCLLISFLDIITNLLSLNRERRQEYIDEICSHDLLVFDDYGAEPSTYFSDMNVLEIISTCYQKRVPMIVTTSLPPESLNKEGNATRKLALSRLKERCYCLTLVNTQRKKKLAEQRWRRFRDLLHIPDDGQCDPFKSDYLE